MAAGHVSENSLYTVHVHRSIIRCKLNCDRSITGDEGLTKYSASLRAT